MDISDVLKEYDIVSPLKTEKLELGGVNLVHAFYIEKNGAKYLLKSIRDDYVAQVDRACKITELLRDRGFNKTTQNIKRNGGEYIFKDADNLNWELQLFIKGKHIQSENLNAENIKSLATTLTKLHNTFLTEAKPNSIELGEEIPYIEMFDSEQHEKMVEAVESLISAQIPNADNVLLLEYWEKYQDVRAVLMEKVNIRYQDLQKSIIHRDLNKGNILFSKTTNDVISFIDWDTVMWGNIIQDVCYLASHYLLIRENSQINKDLSKNNIQTFVDEYQNKIRFNSVEKALFVDLVDVLNVRATRWWTKRYLELYKLSKDDKKYADNYEVHRGGFKKTLTNWVKDRDTILEIFHSLDL